MYGVFAYDTSDDLFYFTFDDANLSGSNPLDISGNGVSATNNGATTGVSGILKQSFSYDGANDFVDLNNFDFTGSDTSISLWVNFDTLSPGATDRIFSNNYFEIIYDNTNIIAQSYDTGYCSLSYAHSGLSTGTWYNIIYTQANLDTELFIEGVSVDTDNCFTTTSNSFNTNVAAEGSGGKYFQGDIDELLVANKIFTSSDIVELYNGGSGFNPYEPVNTTLDNFSTINTGSFSFDTPVSIGTSYGVVNSITINVSEGEDSPFYYSSSFTTFGAGISDVTATCRVAVDGSEVVSGTRSIPVGDYGNFKLITPPENLTVGVHTVTTECLRDGPGGSNRNFVVNNSQMTEFHLYDSVANTTINYVSIEDAVGFPVTTTPTLLDSFVITTEDVTNTTNLNDVVVHGRATYSYDATGDITTYLVLEETGEVCGNYTRGGSAGSTGSVGTTCLFKDLNSSTTYNFSFYGFTSVGTGDVAELLMNVYNIRVNETASSTEVLDMVVPAATNTTVATINISNPLGGSFNVFVDSGIMVNSNVSQDAYFWIQNTENSINYYRTLPSSGTNGNVNGQFVFTETGTDVHTYDLMAYCPGGCNVSQGDLTAFVTNAESVSTGLFTITAYNSYNDSEVQVFNATIAGTTLSTTNGSIDVIAQGTINILVEAQNFFSNLTNHDTTTDFNASLTKYVTIQAVDNLGNRVYNFSVNMTGFSVNTTDGFAFLPVSTLTNVTFSGDIYITSVSEIDKQQYFNFSAFRKVDINIFFLHEENLSEHDDITFELKSDVFSGTYSTGGDNNVFIQDLPQTVYEVRYPINKDGTYRLRSNYFNIPIETVDDYNFTLYTILKNESIFFSRIVTNEDVIPLVDFYLEIQRPYVSTDNTSVDYRSVERALITVGGDAVFSAYANTQAYRFRLLNESLDLVIGSSPAFLIDQDNDLIFNVQTSVTTVFDATTGVTGLVYFNNVTNSFVADYTGADSSTNNCLVVSFLDGLDVNDTLTCSTSPSDTLASGINISENRSYTAKFFVTIDGNLFYPFESVSLNKANTDDLPSVTFIGAIIWFLIIIVSATIGSYGNPVPGIVLALGSTLALGLSFVGLIGLSSIVLSGLLVVGIIVLYYTFRG